ncbi:hypothetical protein E1301_Tti008648 [Triplophysa tibetana]|uniref:Uncharacterized protein n=1 Tax=Triplophysa tibetana TaxID=1572043 RepID=A0A5A9PMN0_9TELE|nr:hypothetical protein E1301_Tti008648 [Triplophysa tibetana]
MVRRFKAPVLSVSVYERNHGYRDKCPRGHLSPEVLPRLPETFLCTDSLISPILRRTEPDPRSKPATGLRTPVNAASLPLAAKPCAYVFNAAGPETDLSFDIDRLPSIDTPSSIRFTPLQARHRPQQQVPVKLTVDLRCDFFSIRATSLGFRSTVAQVFPGSRYPSALLAYLTSSIKGCAAGVSHVIYWDLRYWRTTLQCSAAWQPVAH